MTVYVGCEVEGTAGCCGVMQLTAFSTLFGSKGGTEWRTFSARGKDAEEAYKKLFDRIHDYEFSDTDKEYSCSVLQIWFVKYKNYNDAYNAEFEAAPLMRLVEAIPGVIDLGEHYNVNSGNLIKGYQWKVA